MVVASDHTQRATSLDQRGQLALQATRNRGVGDRVQALLGDVVEDVEDAEPPPVGGLFMNEVERPARVGLGFYQDRLPHCARHNRARASAAPSFSNLHFARQFGELSRCPRLPRIKALAGRAVKTCPELCLPADAEGGGNGDACDG